MYFALSSSKFIVKWIFGKEDKTVKKRMIKDEDLDRTRVAKT